MKTHLEQEDVDAVASALIEKLKPFLSYNGRSETDDAIFDVKGLCDYLKVSRQWIYERTHLKEIPHLKIDGQLRFRKRDIDKWLNTFNVRSVSSAERMLKAVRRGEVTSL